MPKIPDRWIKYTPIGQQVLGTRLIAFKVPLSPSVCKYVENETKRLDINKLLDTVPRLGLVIDLTNTQKYYDPQTFQGKGVEYVKIMVPGHVVPKPNLRKRFREAVRNFLENNLDNDKLIGVHCTHGVNRTGYFICDYMVSDLCIEPEDAIQRFKIARGHPIERKNYIASLSGTDSTNATDAVKPQRRGSVMKNSTSNVPNWRSPDYPYQRNSQHKQSSDTSYQSNSDRNSNWRNECTTNGCSTYVTNSKYNFNTRSDRRFDRRLPSRSKKNNYAFERQYENGNPINIRTSFDREGLAPKSNEPNNSYSNNPEITRTRVDRTIPPRSRVSTSTGNSTIRKESIHMKWS